MAGFNARMVESGVSGQWTVSIAGSDVTFFRGAPTVIGSLVFTEPYGPSTASLTFPKVSGLEPFGLNSSELRWLRDGAPVTVMWRPSKMFSDTLATPSARVAVMGGADPKVVPAGSTTGGHPEQLRWDGRIVSVNSDNGVDGTSVECVGALHVFDNYLAQPFTGLRPYPVEQAIARALRKANQRHPTGVSNLQIIIDEATSVAFAPDEYARSLDPQTKAQKRKKPYYLKPMGLVKNERWTGVTTRQLGSWNRTLSEFTDPLLKLLRTAYGQYTIRLYFGTLPILHHRSHLLGDQLQGLVIVNLMMPGVQAKFSHDYTQTITTVYGKTSTTLSGTEYDGQVFSADGKDYWYAPFALSPWVDPDRGQAQAHMMRREVYDEFEYLQPDEAIEASRRHLAVMGDTGVIADVSITGVDPYLLASPAANLDAETLRRMPFPRQLITPGMRVRLDGLHGQVPGPVAMVTEATHNPDEDVVSFRVDSKFRDYMTVQELRMRSRDALKPTHSLVLPSDFQLNITDPLIPWSYAKGCGYFPRASHKMWKRFTNSANTDALKFPDDWYAMTRAFPPKDPANAKYYSKIRKATGGRGSKAELQDPTVFWNTRSADQKVVRDDVLLSQQGTIDHTQFVCVDEDGNPVPAVFHVSIWQGPTWPVNAVQLPATPEGPPEGVITEVRYTNDKGKQKKHYAFVTKGDGQPGGPSQRYYMPSKPYPFFKSAWDSVDVLGRAISGRNRGKMYIGWGNYWEQAGFWPGSSRTGDKPTGVFADSTDWQYNQADKSTFSSYDYYTEPAKGDPDPEIEVATARVLIYCDSHPKKDLYFLGRMYKKREA